jgi:hypothetical protein
MNRVLPALLVAAGFVALVALATHRPPPPVNPGRAVAHVVVR